MNPYLQKIDEFTFENKNDEEKEDPWADFKEWKRNEVKKSKVSLTLLRLSMLNIQ